MEELHLERQLFAAPQRVLRQEADRPIMVVVDILRDCRAVCHRRPCNGLLGKVARHLPHDGPVERRRLGVRAGEKLGRGDGYQRGSSEEISAVHETTLRLLTATLCNAVHTAGFLAQELDCRFFPLHEIWT